MLIVMVVFSTHSIYNTFLITEPIRFTRKSSSRDVLTRMKNIQGPLARLKDCMDTRTKVKVMSNFVFSSYLL